MAYNEMNTNEITFANYTPPSIQFFEGDKIIKLKFDGTLELGAAWADHNDVATAIFNQIVDHVMPAWKRAVRMEERAAVVGIVKERIDIINGFINGLADNKIKVPDELFSALVELRSLLRELQGA